MVSSLPPSRLVLPYERRRGRQSEFCSWQAFRHSIASRDPPSSLHFDDLPCRGLRVGSHLHSCSPGHGESDKSDLLGKVAFEDQTEFPIATEDTVCIEHQLAWMPWGSYPDRS